MPSSHASSSSRGISSAVSHLASFASDLLAGCRFCLFPFDFFERCLTIVLSLCQKKDQAIRILHNHITVNIEHTSCQVIQSCENVGHLYRLSTLYIRELKSTLSCYKHVVYIISPSPQQHKIHEYRAEPVDSQVQMRQLLATK